MAGAVTEGTGPRPATRWREISLYVATGALSLLLLVPVLRLDKADLRVPLQSSGDAAFYQGVIIRPLMTQPWYIVNSDLGAPYGLELYDYPAGTDTLLYLVMKPIAVLTRDSAVTLNIFYLLTYPLVAVGMLFAARSLGLRRTTSVAVSLLFAFLAYHLLRGEAHVALSAYFMLPPGLIVALRNERWSGPDGQAGSGTARAVSRFGWARPLRTKRFAGVCLVGVVFGLTGVYYALFFVIMLLLMGALAAVRRRTWSLLVAPALTSLAVAATVYASNLPTVLYQWRHGPNLSGAIRGFFDAEVLGLRPIQLILPNSGHAIMSWRQTARVYDGLLSAVNPLLVNESRTATLGVIAAAGFVVLVIWALLRLRAPENGPEAWRRMPDLAGINLAMLVLGTVGGLGFTIAFFVTPVLRGYNRVSVVIAMVSLLAVGGMLDSLADRWRGMPKWVPAAVAVVLVVGGVLDQTSRLWVPDYAATKSTNSIQREFARSAQEALPERAMVFQLPFVTFPGNDRPLPDDFAEYDLLIPYTYSDGLRWSFPSMRGRGPSEWQRSVADSPVPAMVRRLREADFSAVYVDREGFEDGGDEVVRDLRDELGEPIVESEDGRMMLWALDRS